MTETNGEAKNPLSRWSERKQVSRRGEALDEPVADIQATEPAPVETTTPAAAPTEESEAPPLPSIDDLDFQSDYTQFLTQKVPEELRRAALRKLWASDPVLANLDGLNDYDEEFNVVDQVITLAQSSYQPVTGYLDTAEKKLAQINEMLGGEAKPDSSGLSEQSAGGADDDSLRDQNSAPLELDDAPHQSTAVKAGDAAPELAQGSDE